MTTEFPIRGEDESYEQWSHRLVAYTHILRNEIDDLKDTIRTMKEFRRAVDRLDRFYEHTDEEGDE